MDGSGIIAPITKLVAAEFKNSNSNSADISLKTSGTGGGFRKFYAGETDINEASRPILLEEMDACKQANTVYLEIPIRLTSKRDGFILDTDFNPITIYQNNGTFPFAFNFSILFCDRRNSSMAISSSIRSHHL